MNSLKSKNINFYKVYTRKPGKDDKKGVNLLLVLPPLALALALAGVCYMNSRSLETIKKQCEQNNVYLNDPNVAAQYSEYEAKMSELTQATLRNRQFAAANTALGSYPKVDSSVINAVAEAAGETVKVIAYEYSDDTGALSIQAVTKDVNEPAAFSKRLEGTGKFMSVSYFGYELQESGDYAGYYMFADYGVMIPGNLTEGADQR